MLSNARSEKSKLGSKTSLARIVGKEDKRERERERRKQFALSVS